MYFHVCRVQNTSRSELVDRRRKNLNPVRLEIWRSPRIVVRTAVVDLAAQIVDQLAHSIPKSTKGLERQRVDRIVVRQRLARSL